MNTQRRIDIYSQQRRITPAMRRRLVKKAGRDPEATVVRDSGMGYPPAMQGRRELIGFFREPGDPLPTSSAPCYNYAG